MAWLGLAANKFHTWKKRYGMVNDHNGKIPRDWWLADWERQAIVAFHDKNPLEGYRRLTFMMLDDDIVAVSPSTVYRVLKAAGRLDRKSATKSLKGTGFKQPKKPHSHWHTDVSYINVGGTFFYLITVLDGFSRYIVHHELRESMTEVDIEIVIQAALEKHPGVKPRIISDNGPQYIAKDFKAFVRFNGLTHVTTSPYYPQSNGKQERFYGTLKTECIRPNPPRDRDEAVKQIAAYVCHYNETRLHSGIGYITPADCLNGLSGEIHAERDRKLEEARSRRREQASLAIAS
ncbi:IS2 transposase TnpB [Stieleria bergensis]|uniref:IS2 transposase TnpB n=1 Tax=Stieleria bergensis TaxID=2528025 RepID=A0A517STC3_9BACT|nr:IS2 transposase TnpB [Planctomycetes bacterium SV_7m_r]QDT59360.1 IS2 transposase TnpB [Planctomycetes bacterium SV_7m_r]QDT62439.1 IS2 transposase TnpB [Planctomycetes bacterium SV_7m_r]